VSGTGAPFRTQSLPTPQDPDHTATRLIVNRQHVDELGQLDSSRRPPLEELFGDRIAVRLIADQWAAELIAGHRPG